MSDIDVKAHRIHEMLATRLPNVSNSISTALEVVIGVLFILWGGMPVIGGVIIGLAIGCHITRITNFFVLRAIANEMDK